MSFYNYNIYIHNYLFIKKYTTIEAQQGLIVWIFNRTKRRDLHSYFNYATLAAKTIKFKN